MIDCLQQLDRLSPLRYALKKELHSLLRTCTIDRGKQCSYQYFDVPAFIYLKSGLLAKRVPVGGSVAAITGFFTEQDIIFCGDCCGADSYNQVFEAIEPAHFIYIRQASIADLLSKHMQLRQLVEVIREKEVQRLARIANILSLPGSNDRYRAFIAAQPALSGRLPAHELSAFLGYNKQHAIVENHLYERSYM